MDSDSRVWQISAGNSVELSQTFSVPVRVSPTTVSRLSDYQSQFQLVVDSLSRKRLPSSCNEGLSDIFCVTGGIIAMTGALIACFGAFPRNQVSFARSPRDHPNTISRFYNKQKEPRSTFA